MNKTHSQEKAAEQALKFLEKKKVKNKSFRKPPRGSALNVIKKRSTMELVNERFSNTSKKLTDDKLFEKSSKQSHSLDSSHNNDSILKNSLKATENSVLEESKSKSLSSDDDSDAEPTPLEELGGIIVYDNKAQLFGS